MIALRWNAATGEADAVRRGGNLLVESGLATAVMISLFTDRAPNGADGDPVGKGYWADSLSEWPGFILGSYLWKLQRAKTTVGALRDAETWAKDALAWMVADGVASSVTADAVVAATGVIHLRVAVMPPDESSPFISYWEVPYAVL